jgi:hypothetical protein
MIKMVDIHDSSSRRVLRRASVTPSSCRPGNPPHAPAATTGLWPGPPGASPPLLLTELLDRLANAFPAFSAGRVARLSTLARLLRRLLRRVCQGRSPTRRSRNNRVHPSARAHIAPSRLFTTSRTPSLGDELDVRDFISMDGVPTTVQRREAASRTSWPRSRRTTSRRLSLTGLGGRRVVDATTCRGEADSAPDRALATVAV